LSAALWFCAGMLGGMLASGILLRVRHIRSAASDVSAAVAASAEQGAAHQREALLVAALDAAPSAIVVFSDVGRIALTNGAARELFFDGRDPRDENFLALVGRAPEALRRALSSDGDELLTIDDVNGERQTYHLAKRRFSAAGEPVVLVLAKNLSRELYRQEADAWKRMIRVFSHELNNSLAPISSLVHSARVVLADVPSSARLERIFSTIAERADHLRTFLDSYARVARLPPPHKQEVPWSELIDRLLALWPAARLEGDLPEEPAFIDRGQFEQVAINLLKNAEEAGGASDAITVSVSSLGARGARFTVADRGAGMSPEIIQTALVPFYTTKEHGSGLGLPLCREIVEAHGGSLRLENRKGGGLAVHVRLPGRTRAADEEAGKLTLSRS
jgi:two-component system nitrogen regulation sensor histidine kinase NtrY